MKTFNLDHVNRLSKGKRSGVNIGSRTVGHYLRPHERSLYERSLRKGFMELTIKHRDNLWHIWEKACIAQNWQCLIFFKDLATNRASIYIDGELAGEYELNEARQLILEKAQTNLC